jgi:hypothetical protein
MIATNIPLFQGINQLPIILDPIILDEGGGIEETLRRNNAKYLQPETFHHLAFGHIQLTHLSSCFVMACQSSNVEFSFSHKNTYDLQC